MNEDAEQFTKEQMEAFYHYAEDWGFIDYVTGQRSPIDPRLLERDKHIEVILIDQP